MTWQTILYNLGVALLGALLGVGGTVAAPKLLADKPAAAAPAPAAPAAPRVALELPLPIPVFCDTNAMQGYAKAAADHSMVAAGQAGLLLEEFRAWRADELRRREAEAALWAARRAARAAVAKQ